MEKESPPKNEVRVTMKTRVASYLRYVYHTLEKDEEKHQNVVLKAAGRAIARLVPLVELIKRRIVGLHQENKISSVNVVDEIRGEKHERRIVMLEIVLSKVPLDKATPGYQQPLPEDEVEKYQEVLESREESAPAERSTRGGRVLRAGFRGGFRGSFRGGFRGQQRGGYRGGFRGGFRGAPRGGYRDEYTGGRGGYRDESTGGRGGYRDESTGGRGGYRGAPREYHEGGYKGEHRDDYKGEHRDDYKGETRGGFRGESRGEFRGRPRGQFRVA